MVTLNYQVNAGANDGYWYGTTFSSTNDHLLIGNTSSQSIHNFAVWNVTIPAGAIITAAYLSFYFYFKTGTPPVNKIYFEKAANPSPVASYTDGNGRARTTAYVSWRPPGSGTWNSTPDISSIITELIGAYSYASGANMQMIIDGPTPSGNNYDNDYTYEYSDHSYAPKLHIEYTVASGISDVNFMGLDRGVDCGMCRGMR